MTLKTDAASVNLFLQSLNVTKDSAGKLVNQTADLVYNYTQMSATQQHMISKVFPEMAAKLTEQASAVFMVSRAELGNVVASDLASRSEEERVRIMQALAGSRTEVAIATAEQISQTLTEVGIDKLSDEEIKALTISINRLRDAKVGAAGAPSPTAGIGSAGAAGIFKASWVGVIITLLPIAINLIQKFAQRHQKVIDDAKTAYNELTEATKKLQEQTAAVFDDNTKGYSEMAQRYAKLAQGVNQFTGENQTLSNDDYKEYVSLTDQLADLFPNLIAGYTDSGTAILNLRGDYDGLLSVLQETLDAQRAIAASDARDKLSDLWNGAIESRHEMSDELRANLAELDAYRRIASMPARSFQSFDQDAEKLEALLNKLGIQYSKISSTSRFGDTLIDFDFNETEFQRAWSEYESSLQAAVKSALHDNIVDDFKQFNAGLVAALADNIDFRNLTPALRQGLSSALNVNWKGLGFEDADSVLSYVTDTLLPVFKNNAAEFEIGFNLVTQFNKNEISVGEYEAKLNAFNSLLDSLGLKDEIVVAIKAIFDTSQVTSGDVTTNILDQLGLDRRGGKVVAEWVKSLTGGELQLLLKLLADLPPNVHNLQDLQDAFNALANSVEATENDLDFESLDKFKDAISSLNDAFDDLSADGSLGVTYSHLAKIKEQFADVDGIDEYINRLADTGTNAEEVNKILNELAATKVLEQAKTLAEAGANEQLIRALLEEAGVTNAAETASDTLTVARGELALKTAIAEGSLDQFNNSLNEEGTYSDWARIQLLALEAQMISLNEAGLDLDAQVQQIQNVGLAAGLSAAQLWNLKVAAGGATEDYVQSVTDAISKMVVAPYTFNSAPKTSGGGSSKSANETRIEEIVKKYESATTDIQYQLNLLERQYEQLEANGDLEGMNANLAKQTELHQQLKDAAHNTADTLRAFGASTELSAEEAAELAKQLDALSGAWFDSHGDQGESNKQRFDNDLENIKKRIEENGDAVNGWRQALELLDDYFNRGLISYKDYVDTRKELGQEWVDAEIEAVDDYIAATDDAVTAWKSALSSLEQAYANELISFKTYSEKHKEIGENLYNAEIDAIDEYIDRCNALNDWGTDNEVSARRKQLAVTEDYYRQGLISYEKYKDSYNSYTQALYDAEMDALEKRAQQQKKRIEEQIKALEKRKEAVEKSMSGYDATVNALTDFIDKAIDALDEENSELEKQRELQEKLMEIERLKHQQTLRIYREGVGFVYEQDTEAIKEAQDAYDSLVEEMDKDRAKEKLEDLKEAIQSITSQYTDEKNAALAAAILGEGWEDTWTEYVNRMVAGGDAGDSAMATLMRQIRGYAGQYSNLSRQVDEDVKGSITSQINSLNDASDKWDEWLENVREANYLYVDELYNVTDIEAEQYDMRLDNLSDYVESSVLEYQKLAAAAAGAAAAQSAANNPTSGTSDEYYYQSGDVYAKKINSWADLATSGGSAVEWYRDESGVGRYYTSKAKSAAAGQTADDVIAILYGGIQSGQISSQEAAETLYEITSRSGIQNNQEKYEALLEAAKEFASGHYARGGVVDYDGIAVVHGGQSPEVVFNGDDANKLYNYIHTTPDLIASMLNSLGTPSIGSSFYGRIKSVMPKPSAELTGGNNASVTIGTINLHEVQNVDGLAKAIENELPGRITQMFYKR